MIKFLFDSKNVTQNRFQQLIIWFLAKFKRLHSLHVVSYLVESLRQIFFEDKRKLISGLLQLDFWFDWITHCLSVYIKEIYFSWGNQIKNRVTQCFKVVFSGLVKTLVSPNWSIFYRSKEAIEALRDMLSILFSITFMCTEICNIDFSIFNSEVGGLNVSMQKAKLVKLLNCYKHFGCYFWYHRIFILGTFLHY